MLLSSNSGQFQPLLRDPVESSPPDILVLFREKEEYLETGLLRAWEHLLEQPDGFDSIEIRNKFLLSNIYMHV